MFKDKFYVCKTQKRDELIKLEDINTDIRLGMLDFEAFSKENASVSKREMEQKATQYLLKEMLKTYDFKIVNDEFNKPFLEGRTEQLSISHSHRWLAIAIHQTKDIGVDIELMREKILNIKHKFTSDEELNYTKSNIELLTILWAAKEAIYKAYGKKNIAFKKICIAPFELKENGVLTGTLQLENEVRKYKLMYRKDDEYYLALVINEI